MFRLVYKSRCSGELSRETVRSILHESSKLNEEAGVTGALLATDTHFLQVLEGEFDALNDTFRRISMDKRHENVELISFGPASERLFEGWAMRGLGVFDLNTELETELRSKYGEEDGSLCFPVREWEALALISDVHMLSSRSCRG